MASHLDGTCPVRSQATLPTGGGSTSSAASSSRHRVSRQRVGAFTWTGREAASSNFVSAAVSWVRHTKDVRTEPLDVRTEPLVELHRNDFLQCDHEALRAFLRREDVRPCHIESLIRLYVHKKADSHLETLLKEFSAHSGAWLQGAAAEETDTLMKALADGYSRLLRGCRTDFAQKATKVLALAELLRSQAHDLSKAGVAEVFWKHLGARLPNALKLDQLHFLLMQLAAEGDQAPLSQEALRALLQGMKPGIVFSLLFVQKDERLSIVSSAYQVVIDMAQAKPHQFDPRLPALIQEGDKIRNRLKARAGTIQYGQLLWENDSLLQAHRWYRRVFDELAQEFQRQMSGWDGGDHVDYIYQAPPVLAALGWGNQYRLWGEKEGLGKTLKMLESDVAAVEERIKQENLSRALQKQKTLLAKANELLSILAGTDEGTGLHEGQIENAIRDGGEASARALIVNALSQRLVQMQQAGYSLTVERLKDSPQWSSEVMLDAVIQLLVGVESDNDITEALNLVLDQAWLEASRNSVWSRMRSLCSDEALQEARNAGGEEAVREFIRKAVIDYIENLWTELSDANAVSMADSNPAYPTPALDAERIEALKQTDTVAEVRNILAQMEAETKQKMDKRRAKVLLLEGSPLVFSKRWQCMLAADNGEGNNQLELFGKTFSKANRAKLDELVKSGSRTDILEALQALHLRQRELLDMLQALRHARFASTHRAAEALRREGYYPELILAAVSAAENAPELQPVLKELGKICPLLLDELAVRKEIDGLLESFSNAHHYLIGTPDTGDRSKWGILRALRARLSELPEPVAASSSTSIEENNEEDDFMDIVFLLQQFGIASESDVKALDLSGWQELSTLNLKVADLQSILDNFSKEEDRQNELKKHLAK